MSYDIIQSPGTPRKTVERRHMAELARISHRADLAEAQVAGIGRVAQRAHYETMLTALAQRQAEQIAPDSAEIYAMVKIAAGVATVQAIGSMGGRY